MVILKKAKGDTSGIKGGLRSVFGAFKDESVEALKQTGKELVKGVTMLPRDLLVGALSGESPQDKKSWEDEWLKNKDKNKPPVSDKEGGHSEINPAKMMQGSEEQKLETARRKIAMELNSRFTRSSATSEYGREQAQEYQKKHKPIYDQIQEEEKQKKEQQQRAAAQQQGQGLAMPTKGTSTRGSVLSKKKHKPSPQELNRIEYRSSGGK